MAGRSCASTGFPAPRPTRCWGIRIRGRSPATVWPGSTGGGGRGGQPTGQDADVEDVRRREAYSWGGLTSGAASRALWLLFMLLNVGFYMTPRPLTQDGGSRWRKASASIQRLLALTLTLSLVLSVVGVAMDLVGWQCGRPGAGCIERHGWLHFLSVGWLDEPRRQLAVTSLVPAMVVALLWWLGRSTWSGNEMTKVPPRQRPPAPRPQDTVLLEETSEDSRRSPRGRSAPRSVQPAAG